MKYMLMMSGTRKGFDELAQWTPGEFKAHVEFMIALQQELTSTGELVLAEGLDMPSRARIVQAKDGRAPTVTDGPFAETKEFLAGFWIVDVVSDARAIAIAAKASAAPGRGGQPIGIPIEVRRVGSAPDV